MRGRIIFINPHTRTGLIFGVDRERYSFDLPQWTQDGLPARNMEVSFDPQGLQALRIKPVGAGEPEPVAEFDVFGGSDQMLATGNAPPITPPATPAILRDERASSMPDIATAAFPEPSVPIALAVSAYAAEGLRARPLSHDHPSGNFPGQSYDEDEDEPGPRPLRAEAALYADHDDGGMVYGADPDGEADENALDPFSGMDDTDVLPRGATVPPTGQILFAMEGGAARPAWPNYALGVGGAAVLLAVAYVAMAVMHGHP